MNGGPTIEEEWVGLVRSAGPARSMLDAERAVASIIDCVGCGIAGLDEHVAQAAAGLMAVDDGLPGLPAGPRRVSTQVALDAAFAHGVAAHALDYDDSMFPGPVHPSCTIVPALYAGSRLADVAGADVIRAYVVGVEAASLLAHALGREHYQAGWHATATIGAMAATAACGALLRLDDDQARHALALAASASGGLRYNIGTETKPIHAGASGRAALLSALLAREGVTGRPDILGAELGFLRTHRAGLAARPPTPPDERSYQIGLKPFPCCGEATSAVEAAARVVLDHPERAVAKARVRTGPLARSVMVYDRPQTPDQARFSLRFCIAATLLRGRLDLAAFSAAGIADVEVAALERRIEWLVEDEWDDGAGGQGTELDVVFTDGTEAHETIGHPLGWAPRELTVDDRRAKFRDCAGARLGGAADQAFDTWLRLESISMAEAIAAVTT